MLGTNAITLVGNISEPRLIKFSDGDDNPRGELTEFWLVTTRSWKKGGEFVYEQEFHSIRIYNPRLIDKAIFSELAKGMTVSVTGRLQYDRWTDANGVEQRRAVISAEKLDIQSKRSPRAGIPAEPESPALAPSPGIAPAPAPTE